MDRTRNRYCQHDTRCGAKSRAVLDRVERIRVLLSSGEVESDFAGLESTEQWRQGHDV